MGVQPMAAHMFVFYVAALAPITPPVALAAYAAAGIADANPLTVGTHAVKIAMVAFFLPYFFVLNPALLGYGTLLEIVLPFATAALGVFVLGFATQGFFKRSLRVWERLLCGAFALSLILPENYSDFIGVAGIAVMVLFFAKTAKRQTPSLGA
jgi:TRAP-type uncharacterized transport system fused permease subunit